MPRIFVPVFLILLVTALGGCGDSQNTTSSASSANPEVSSHPAPTVTSELGAWLGEGLFTAQNGTQQVKAQMELLADGTYRFMVIEPRALMMVVGLETGKWQRAGQELKLMPLPDQTSEATGKFGALHSAPKNFSPKSLTVEGDAFVLKDAQMDMRFLPNHKATQKLAQRGDLG